MMQFYKYQGTGNDFILLDDRDRVFPATDQERIERLCNRRFGIGADGLILLQTREDGGFYMQYFNSDGRESSMCGNGGRCFAQFIMDMGLGKSPISFHAIDGPHEAMEAVSASGEKWIRLKMKDVESFTRLEEGTYEINTGSPHYVQFREETVTDLDLVQMARQVRYNEPYTREGINVNYLNLLALKEVRLRTYERGVEDETLSCGTGATAAALSTALFNNLPRGRHTIDVEVMGGELLVDFMFDQPNGRFEDIWLTGPAKKVFEGRLPD